MIVLVWRPRQKRRKPGCAFYAINFQRTRLSSVRRRLAASLILELRRRESGRGSSNQRCHRGLRRSQASLLLAAASPIRDKSKVPGGKKTCPTRQPDG